MEKLGKIPQKIELDSNGGLLTDPDGKKYRYSEDGEKFGGDFPEKPSFKEKQEDDNLDLPLVPVEINQVI